MADTAVEEEEVGVCRASSSLVSRRRSLLFFAVEASSKRARRVLANPSLSPTLLSLTSCNAASSSSDVLAPSIKRRQAARGLPGLPRARAATDTASLSLLLLLLLKAEAAFAAAVTFILDFSSSSESTKMRRFTRLVKTLFNRPSFLLSVSSSAFRSGPRDCIKSASCDLPSLSLLVGMTNESMTNCIS